MTELLEESIKNLTKKESKTKFKNRRLRTQGKKEV